MLKQENLKGVLNVMDSKVILRCFVELATAPPGLTPTASEK